MEIKIITDSMSDISEEVAEEYDIEVLHVSISLDEKYVPTNEADAKQTVEWMKTNKKFPKFKGIPIETYEGAFKKYVEQGMAILCIVSYSDRISNYNNALFASTQFPDAKIQIFDSHQFSTSVGLVALQAVAMAKNKSTISAIVSKLERSMNKIALLDLIDSLEFFEYSGSMSRITAARNALLNSKFVVTVLEKGKIKTDLVGHNMDKAVKNYFRAAFENLREIEPNMILLSYTISDEKYFEEMHEYVKSLRYFEKIIVSSASVFSTAYTGPNCLKIAYQLK